MHDNPSFMSSLFITLILFTYPFVSAYKPCYQHHFGKMLWDKGHKEVLHCMDPPLRYPIQVIIAACLLILIGAYFMSVGFPLFIVTMAMVGLLLGCKVSLKNKSKYTHAFIYSFFCHSGYHLGLFKNSRTTKRLSAVIYSLPLLMYWCRISVCYCYFIFLENDSLFTLR
jgi:ribose/xylose/arabinose/galactoside ABC-type transport system permease subunit